MEEQAHQYTMRHHGPGTFMRFPHTRYARTGTQDGDLESAVETPDSDINLHLMIAEQIGLSRIGDGAGLFDIFSPMASSTHALVYSISVYRDHPMDWWGPRLAHRVGMLDRKQCSAVGGMIIKPGDFIGVTRASQYGDVVTHLLNNDFAGAVSPINIHTYDEPEEIVTQRVVDRALDSLVESGACLRLG
ncbi:hypothetical protein HN419_05855 [Candidatus Woesearchaeota archaeon]|jgi:hypothetical protein|nr:hypothetical protein [Candidatus Woesearchaeota archaeon]MBT3537605.1 hypothetical protein [Candidatus Woesearchaeota archaeon]MBT4696893.1 hypothetical protein [Candidatus Woesearchaeota archaeon]MBT7105274.1 hypothetical protein [Candidatus Woesearchaeota archaeon]MBT7930537.1 hypothetical protein [Candidatus Woesearchaeota archaeon]